MSGAIAQFFGILGSDWLATVVAEIQRFTDRPIVIRTKDQALGPLSETLRDAWAVVAFNSNVAVEAIAAGVPCFALGPSAATLMSPGPLSEIERPRYPSREQWLHTLAYKQWTLAEIGRGEHWEHL